MYLFSENAVHINNINIIGQPGGHRPMPNQNAGDNDNILARSQQNVQIKIKRPDKRSLCITSRIENASLRICRSFFSWSPSCRSPRDS